MKSPSFTLALPFLAGLAVGVVGVWSFHRFGTGTPSGPATAHASPHILAPALTLPPLLAGAEADDALDAYLALPPLPDKAPASVLLEKRNRLLALLTLLPGSHVERLFASLTLLTGDSEAQLRREVFQVWTERNAPAAARAALALVPDGAIKAEERSLLIQQAAMAWARDDFAAAYGWASGFVDAGAGRDLAVRLLAQLAATDPKASLALAAAGDETFLSRARLAIFRAWSDHDPAAALHTLAPILLEQRANGWVVQKMLAKWLILDPTAALDWALAQPVLPDSPDSSLLSNVGWMVMNNPKVIRPLLDQVAERENLPGRNQIIQSLFSAWLGKDYASAVRWLDTVTDTARRSELVGQALAYSSTDRPDDFITLIRLLPSAAQQEAALAQRLSAWAETDPEAALTVLRRHKGPEFAAATRAVEETLIVNLANTDATAAVARWEALPADASRVKAATRLAEGWAKTDPAAASQWLAQHFPDALKNNSSDYTLNRTLRDVTTRWALSDPLGFVDWTRALPDEGRALATEAFANPNAQWWATNDNMPTPSPRAAYAGKLSQIKDPEIRERALLAHLGQWGRADAHAVRAWIAANNALTPETTAVLLARLRNPR